MFFWNALPATPELINAIESGCALMFPSRRSVIRISRETNVPEWKVYEMLRRQLQLHSGGALIPIQE